MIKKSYILHFFFCVAVLTLLTACGGGGGAGDEGVGDNDTCNPILQFCKTPDQIVKATCADNNLIPTKNIYDCKTGVKTCDNTDKFCHGTKTPRDTCEPRSHTCGEQDSDGLFQGTGIERACNDIKKFCGEGETQALRSACMPATHDCGENNQGTGKLTCDNSKNFCFDLESQAPRAGCVPETHDCGVGNQGTGVQKCDNSERFCFDGDMKAVRADCEPATHRCGVGNQGTGAQYCNPETHFCYTSGIAKSTCNIATHDCEGTGDGTGVRTCNPETHFCYTTKAPHAGCDRNSHDCDGDGALLACNDITHFCGTGESQAPRADCEPRSHECGAGNQGTGARLACNDITHFCGTGESRTPRADCEPRSHACGVDDHTNLPQGTGVELACNDITHFCGTGESQTPRADCEPRSHKCGVNDHTNLPQGDGLALACNDITHFCGTGETGAERATCNSRSHECGAGNQGTGFARTCNDLTHFCGNGETEELRATCDPRSHDCGVKDPNNNNLFSGTGKLSDCNDYDRFCGEGESRTLRTECEPRSHDCGPDATGLALDCNDITHFCGTGETGAERATCDTRSHDCGADNQGTGLALDCNDITHFCFTPGKVSRGDDCNILLFNCENGARLQCNTLIKICDENSDYAGLYNTGGVDSATGYEPPNTEIPPTGGWVAALAAARTTEYHASGGADRIGVAYAHARGHTGEGVIVSLMGFAVDRTNKELSGQLIPGFEIYETSNNNISENKGTCGTSIVCGNDNLYPTFAAGIIAGKQGNDGIQGIAYNAKIKPINIISKITGNDIDEAAFISPIKAGSGIVDKATCTASSVKTITACKSITVMNVYDRGNRIIENIDYEGQSYRFHTTRKTSAISGDELKTWKTAVDTTVVVVGAGDEGHNSETGQVTLLGDAEILSGVDWSIVDAANGSRNLSTTRARLPIENKALEKKWLTVIALDDRNRIWRYSNGCGDTKTWCLGAPGVDFASGKYTLSSTTVAAAHVTGAVAVLAEAFPHLDPDELVRVILDTADYIPENDSDKRTSGTNRVYGHGALNLARATEPVGHRRIALPSAPPSESGLSLDNSGITLPTSFGGALTDLTVGFTDDYDRAFIGFPERIAQQNIAFTLDETMATWDSPELQSITLDSNSKMQFTNYDESEHAKDTLMFTHHLPNHTIGFTYNEESKTPDLMLAGDKDEMHFQKILPIASDLMQLHATHKLSKNLTVKNALTSGEFDTGNRFNEAMTNLNYTGENSNLTIGAGTLQEYGQFLGASGTGAYQLSDATSSQVTHLAITQNLPLGSAIKLKYTGFKTEVDMRYSNFAKINDLTADEYQLSFGKKQILGKNDSLNLELIQPFAVTDGKLQQSTVLGYNEAGDYNNVTQNYNLAPTNRRQQIRMTWQNLLSLKNKTRLFISMQYDKHVNNLRDNEQSSILGGISTRF